MELVNAFTVQRPLDEAWAVLTDLERIAPCLPGAKLEEIEGDIYRGVVKVKVGPITAAFKGQAHFVERDDADHRAVLKGEGRDTGGKGNASALITAHLEPVSEGVSKCTVLTDLSITGKVAQFGRGAMADVSEKLMAQFATNLNTMLEGTSVDPQPAPAAAPAAAAEAPAADEAPAAPVADAALAAATPATSEPRKIDSADPEPLDLLATAGSPMLKRALPVVVGVLVLLLLFGRRKGRCRG
jgi:carbon monoxide dehydrogenase subunit G